MVLHRAAATFLPNNTRITVVTKWLCIPVCSYVEKCVTKQLKNGYCLVVSTTEISAHIHAEFSLKTLRHFEPA
jgi:hypothetical protein